MEFDNRRMAEVLHERFDELHFWAQQDQKCKRKSVGCEILKLERVMITSMARTKNGPCQGHECTGEKGKCGCAHSEPRAIFKALPSKKCDPPYVMVANYSPCENCANAIIDCGIIHTLIYQHYAPHWPRGVEFLKHSEVNVLSDSDLVLFIKGKNDEWSLPRYKEWFIGMSSIFEGMIVSD